MRPDPAMLGAPVNPRIPLDAYFTVDADMCVKALVDALPGLTAPDVAVLEPAAGAGHLVVSLNTHGVKNVTAQDVMLHPNALTAPITQCDVKAITSLKGYTHVVTNLPYNIQDDLLRHLLPLAARDGVTVAILTRAAWHFAKRRKGLVHNNPNFAGVVHLPRRPWWTGERKSSPRHDFVWNIWDAKTVTEPTIYYPI